MFKRLIYFSVILFFPLILVLDLILPDYKKITIITSANNQIHQQLTKRQNDMDQQLQLKKKISLLQNSKLAQANLQKIRSSDIYNTLSFLAKNNHLTITKMKPLPSENLDPGFIKQTIFLKIDGTEASLLQFLKLMLLQKWVTQIVDLDLSADKNLITLTITLIFYYETK
ncbi:MAG: hypothetical protein JSR33_02025 [Proteobacteria bacterium]|nr:hypothetical protein [Pseudomonadota bacterium]